MVSALAILLPHVAMSASAVSNQAQIRSDLSDNDFGKDSITGHRPAFAGGALLRRAIPSNQWYSSALFQWPTKPIYAQPLSIRANSNGLEIAYPHKTLENNTRGVPDVRYPHAMQIQIRPSNQTLTGAQLVDSDDWRAKLTMLDNSGPSFDATILHGNPYVYIDTHQTELAIDTANGDIEKGLDNHTWTLVSAGRRFAVFLPPGTTSRVENQHTLQIRMSDQANYLSIAALPDDTNAATLVALRAAAFSFPATTRVTWDVDLNQSVVGSHFTVQSASRDGGPTQTLMGVYPHQWSSIQNPPPIIGRYATIRGSIRLITANTFTVQRPYLGFVPWWGPLRDDNARTNIDRLLAGDNAKSRLLFTRPSPGRGTYWTGKSLGALTQLIGIAKATGQSEIENRLLGQLEDRIDSWFQGRGEGYFVQDKVAGTVVGFPDEYGSVSALNDHHFHYGYWLMSAAYIGLLDPDWLHQNGREHAFNMIVADIATTTRNAADFPFLRNVDIYEGHSWASGNADFDAGNNQESSSEAVNAWAALLLLGEATHRPDLRDLGAYLYTTEIAAIQTYWFDLGHEIFPTEFTSGYASMVFGGKYAYNTWWTEEPRQILGINILPLTPASTYLGMSPENTNRLLTFLPRQLDYYGKHGIPDGTPDDIWQDTLAEFAALSDPISGKSLWKPTGTIERGETRTHTQYWLSSLAQMGTPDFSVHANTALFQVFKTANGKRTHLAYNAGSIPQSVRFSDGVELLVGPHQLGISF
jgi:endoglucanase Acf2